MYLLELLTFFCHRPEELAEMLRRDPTYVLGMLERLRESLRLKPMEK